MSEHFEWIYRQKLIKLIKSHLIINLGRVRYLASYFIGITLIIISEISNRIDVFFSYFLKFLIETTDRPFYLANFAEYRSNNLKVMYTIQFNMTYIFLLKYTI